MRCTFIFLLVSARVLAADVVAGPDRIEQARVLDAPISKVIVYSDRAKIKRLARIDLTSGVHNLLFQDLPGVILVDTVRLQCLKAEILRVEASAVEQEGFSIEQVEDLIKQMESLTDTITKLGRKAQVAQLELSFLRAISPKPAVDESKRFGKIGPPLNAGAWMRVLDFLDRRKQSCQNLIRKVRLEREEFQKKIYQVQSEIQRHNMGAFSKRRLQVLVMVQTFEPVRTTCNLEYFVPGASWVPSYEVFFYPDRNRSIIHTLGMVRQATGEDWNNVQLELSTSIPGQDIVLPKLMTWTLGEKREFIPRARPARMPKPPIYRPLPASRLTFRQVELTARREVLKNQLAALQSVGAGKNRSYPSSVAAKPVQRKYRGMSAKRPKRSLSARSKARMSAPPAQMAPGKAVAADQEPEEIILTGSLIRKPAGRALGNRPLALFELDAYTPPRFSDPNLPAVIAGGFDYLFSCKTPVTIPSSGDIIRVPLGVSNIPVDAHYEATPSLMTTAFFKAVVTNPGKQPILQGAVGIFVGNTYIGQGSLKTTGKGGRIELPLGADEDIRIQRRIVPETATEGVFSKDDLTTYTTVIEIANHKKKKIRIRVFDQLPKTRNEDIEIRLIKTVPKPLGKPDADGILKWDLDIPPGQIKKIDFVYQIERPADWQLTQ